MITTFVVVKTNSSGERFVISTTDDINAFNVFFVVVEGPRVCGEDSRDQADMRSDRVGVSRKSGRRIMSTQGKGRYVE